MKNIKVAIIGGTGVYDQSFLSSLSMLEVETPYGVVQLQHGHSGNREVFFLARHGTRHSIPPHKVNYRANIAALRELSVDGIIATAAAGTLRRSMPPGSMVAVDQFIDFTRQRPLTFYDQPGDPVVHTDFSDPYCPVIRKALTAAGASVGLEVIDGGCYICTEGPRFETPAEIRMFATWGADLVGMTNLPEVVLAREAGLCYGALAIPSNYAAGMTETPLSQEEVVKRIEADRPALDRLLSATVNSFAPGNHCHCKTSAGPPLGGSRP